MSALPPGVRARIEELVGDIDGASPVSGGCISNGTRVRSSSGDLFVKWSAGEGGLTFEAEAQGLRALCRADSSLLVPQVVHAVDSRDGLHGLLVLEWIEEGPRSPGFDRRLGEGLAELHAHTEAGQRYGFGTDNFIGRLPQRNTWTSTWPDFFASHRLAPQFELARSSGRWHASWDRPAEKLLTDLPDLLPGDPPPALVHGDLWSGNVLCSASGRPVLIDPATYFGDGETDLAMMRLFGGFTEEVFDVYASAAGVKRDAAFSLRQSIYKLYHVVSHLNHFGSSYAGQVESLLSRLG